MLLSERSLTELVRGGHVAGWNDPRMPTLAGLRRRGVPPDAVRHFMRGVGVNLRQLGIIVFARRQRRHRDR
jgi:glutaminyl-tRNA synthetase